MAIGTDIAGIISNVDKILKKEKLYTTVTYEDVSETLNTYDPISGTYGQASSTTYTFEGVFAAESLDNQTGNAYGGGVQLIILPLQISGLFELEVDQIFTISGSKWQVSSFNTAPVDSVHTVNLRRK